MAIHLIESELPIGERWQAIAILQGHQPPGTTGVNRRKSHAFCNAVRTSADELQTMK
jgi:hypothetical protein